jgi:hypothetical protein
MIDIIVSFENLLKEYKVLFFDKVYEKTRDGSWKLIYNIQGLTTNDTSFFYPNLKFIFWINKEKTEITENVISYLYGQNCEYTSITLEENINDVFDKMLNLIKKEKTNIELSEFILNGTDMFNIALKKDNKTAFASNLTFIPHGNKSCLDTLFAFKLETNTETYYFSLKCLKDSWELQINNEMIQTTLQDVYKKIIEIIYATK